MDRESLLKIEARFAQALASPRPGMRPVVRLIRPYYKRPPFNRTHRVLRRRHRKKSNNPSQYSIATRPYLAIRWVKEEAHPQPSPEVFTSLPELVDARSKLINEYSPPNYSQTLSSANSNTPSIPSQSSVN